MQSKNFKNDNDFFKKPISLGQRNKNQCILLEEPSDEIGQIDTSDSDSHKVAIKSNWSVYSKEKSKYSFDNQSTSTLFNKNNFLNNKRQKKPNDPNDKATLNLNSDFNMIDDVEFFKNISSLTFDHPCTSFLYQFLEIQKRVNESKILPIIQENCVIITLRKQYIEDMYYSELLFNHLFSQIASVGFVFKKHSDKSISNYKIYFNKRSTDKCANTITSTFDQFINKYIKINNLNEVIFFMNDSQVVIEFEESVKILKPKILKLREKVGKLDKPVFENIHIYGDKTVLDIIVKVKEYNVTITDTFEINSYLDEAFTNISNLVFSIVDTLLSSCQCYVNLIDTKRNENVICFRVEFISSTTLLAFKKKVKSTLENNIYVDEIDYNIDN